ncbi:MAG: DUF1573 domain-containing protein [Schleiferiaceae bacterium]|nr:DUF1573 domain-containing protein [Schleiferiaceae bacterium]
MKNWILTLTFAAAAVFGLKAQESNPNAPEITFESTVIDYGTIMQNADGAREFVFTNTGNEPLIITSARSSCGCTVPTPPREPIAPGESSTIKVIYDTKRVGPIMKTVTVESNAKSGKKVLTIKGKVEAAPAQTSTTPVKPKTDSPVMAR